MSDLLEIPHTAVLLRLAEDNTLMEFTETVVLLTEAIQGPPGPPGAPDSGGAAARAVRVDYSSPLYAYVGYPTQICRINYMGASPVVQYAAVSDIDTQWPLRAGLSYA